MNLVRPQRPESILRRMLHPSSRAPLWEKYGLVSHSLRRGMAEPRYVTLPRPNRFRSALEEAGGLFALFGQFLSGRSDLLPGSYLSQLRSLQDKRSPVSPPSSLHELRNLVTNTELIRMAPCSEVYAATCEGRPVILEIYPRDPAELSEKSWRDFCRQIRLLQDAVESPITHSLALEQFREWLRWHADVERKRVVLRNLQEIPIPCVSRFPRLIPELQTTRCLAYERMEGSPLAEGAGSGEITEKNLELWAESLLEQSLLLSLVDGEAQPDNYLVLSGGGIGFRSVPLLVPVPVEWHYELLQYTTSAVTGNSHRAVQMLSRISSSESPYATEQLLLETLSALQPELKINRTTPESIASLENFWRAQARTPLTPPLFLQLFHRNWMALGLFLSSEADPVAEALWPVLGRHLQFRIGEILATEKGQEWLLSSGLLLMTSLRQMAIALEQVRDNDLALLLEGQETGARDKARDRRARSVILSAMALVLFLFFLQLAQRSAGWLQMVATGAAAGSAAALWILVARME